MWKIIIVFILFSIIAKFPVLAFHCYLDTQGSLPPEEGKTLLLDKFKVFDCNLMKSKDEKVRFQILLSDFQTFCVLFQPCMMKTDAKSGLITRNCSPVQKPKGCEIDVHGNTFCHLVKIFLQSNISRNNKQTVTVLLMSFSVSVSFRVPKGNLYCPYFCSLASCFAKYLHNEWDCDRIHNFENVFLPRSN